MTNEQKQLLLKDLCARLPYGVLCRASIPSHKTDTFPEDSNLRLTSGMLNYIWINCRKLRPYLRPMSSMTEEERNEATQFEINNLGPIGCNWNLLVSNSSKLVDWLNEHYFDYRGLIPMGLALEAPKGMYKTE